MRRLVALILAMLAFVQPSAALTPAQELVLFGRGTTYYANLTTGSIPPWLSYASAGVRYYWDASGNLQTAPNNLIPNSAMQGAAVGVFPSGWGLFNSAGGTLSGSVVATGNDGGYPYIDVLFAGTTAGAGYYTISFGPVIAASTGQSVVTSVATKLISGSIPGSFKVGTNINNGSGFVAEVDFTPFTGASPLTITSGAFTIAAANVVSVQPYVTFQFSGVVSPNFTLRIAAPMLSQVTAAQTTPGPFMPTSGSAYYGPACSDHNPSTLAALGCRSEPQRTNLYLNNTAPATQTITVANGTTYTISFYGTGTLTLAGACTTTMTGSAGVRTSYSCTTATTSLVATDVTSSLTASAYPQVETGAFATSPILVYTAAVTVPADNWPFAGVALSQLLSTAGACVAVKAQLEGYTSGVNTFLFSVSDGTTNNFVGIDVDGFVPNTVDARVRLLGGDVAVQIAGGNMVSAPRTSVMSWGVGLPIAAFDGSSAVTVASATPKNLTQGWLGSVNGSNPPSLWFQQIAVRKSCTSAQVTRLSTAGANLRAENDNDVPHFATNANLPLIVKIASGEW